MSQKATTMFVTLSFGCLAIRICDAAHAQFFSDNLLTCPRDKSHNLTKVSNDQTRILAPERLDICDILRSC